MEDASHPSEPVDLVRAHAAELYERSPVPVLALSATGLVLGLNQAAADVLERARSRAVGAPLLTMASVADRDLLLRHVSACVEDQTPRTIELDVALAGTPRRWLLTSRGTVLDGHRLVLTTIVEATSVARGPRARAELADRLLDTLDPELVLEHLARAVVPELADLCAIDLIEGNTLKRRAHVTHVDAERGARFEDVESRWGALPNVSFATLQALQNGTPHLLPAVTADYLQAAAADGEHLAGLIGLALRSWLVVPLGATDDDRALGAVRLATTGVRRPLDVDDLRLAEQLGASAGRALRRARLYQEALGQRHRGKALARDLDDVARALLRARSGLEGRSPPPAAKDLGAAAERVRGIAADLEGR